MSLGRENTLSVRKGSWGFWRHGESYCWNWKLQNKETLTSFWFKDLDNQPISLEINLQKKRRDRAQLEKDKLEMAMETCKFKKDDLKLDDMCDVDYYVDVDVGVKGIQSGSA